ncbi:hypothetical protein Ccel01_08820 [Cellulosimicrobium cellulans]|uniref:Uncharacterized protein n=2 Tax=Cellulosimicrobium cellulans TaxID=1710 RepID=A0AAV5P4N1_CELCE|nr:hypothetical protein Ccel01_08820 [Cellulosimicrobium cellulans]
MAGAGPQVDDRARVDGDACHEVGHRARALVGVAEVEGRVPVAWHDGSVLSQYLDVNNLDIKIHVLPARRADSHVRLIRLSDTGSMTRRTVAWLVGALVLVLAGAAAAGALAARPQDRDVGVAVVVTPAPPAATPTTPAPTPSPTDDDGDGDDTDDDRVTPAPPSSDDDRDDDSDDDSGDDPDDDATDDQDDDRDGPDRGDG